MLLSNKSAFARLSKEEEPDVFIRFFDSPYGFGPGYAMEKGGEWEVLSEISAKTVCDANLKEKLANLIQTDKVLASKIEKHSVLRDGLSKIAQMQDSDDISDVDGLLKQAECDVHYIFANEDGTFTKMAASRQIDEVDIENGLEEYEISDFPVIFAGETEKIAKFDAKTALTQGYTYKLASDEDIFISKEGNYRILVGKDYTMTKKAGYDDGNLDFLAGLADVPTSGDTGVIFNPKDGEIKSNVITMHKVAFFGDGLHRLAGDMSYNDQHMVKFATLRGIDKATYSSESETMYFPEHWVFAKLGEALPDNRLGEVFNEKLAGLEAVRCIGLDHYEFRGPVLRKYAERRDLWEANAHQVAFGVLHCGGDVDDVTKVANLRPGEVHVISNQLSLPYTKEEISIGVEKTAELSDDYLFDAGEILKLAVEMGDENGVDAVLGTAFLKKGTMNRFIGMLPLFEDAASNLAKLLLYVRMGSSGVGETPIREGMKHLTKVIFQLNGVKNMEKVR